MAARRTVESFVKDSNITHSDKYTYEKVVYTNNSTKVIITCKEHGPYLQSPGNHLAGSGCPKCGVVASNAAARSTTVGFVAKAITVHGGRYCYEKTVYVNAKNKVFIICTEHGDFLQTPDNHLHGSGCPRCGALATNKAQAISIEEFVAKADNVHNHTYDYSLVKYVNSKIPVTIVCPKHGLFEKTPYSHTNQEQGCPSCTAYGFSPNLPAILYYLSINNGQAYKIGITNRSVRERFRLKDLSSIQVVSQWEFPLGKDARTLEQRILKAFKPHQYQGEDLLESGNTELFTVDVLLGCTTADDIYELLKTKDTLC